MPNRIVIRNGIVVDTEPAVHLKAPGTEVLIEDEMITGVGTGVAVGDAREIDASGMIVAPGFVDTHRHTWQSQLRGAAADATLTEYMVTLLTSLGPNYRPEDVYIGNLLGAVDFLDSGVTTILDWSHVQASTVDCGRLLDLSRILFRFRRLFHVITWKNLPNRETLRGCPGRRRGSRAVGLRTGEQRR